MQVVISFVFFYCANNQWSSPVIINWLENQVQYLNTETQSFVWEFLPCHRKYSQSEYSKAVAYINNSRHLARKYARIFVHGHYLFLEAQSFPRAQLEENCELRGTDNIQGQISKHIFAPNGRYRVYYPSNLLRNARSFENCKTVF